MKRIVIVSLTLLVFLSACKTRKNRSNRITKGVLDSTKLVLPEIREVVNSSFAFDFLSYKSKCDYKDANMDQSFTMNLRLKFDSIVWISVTAVGFEVARAKLDRDSIRILNRLEKKYYVYDYAFIKQLAGADLSLVQIQYLLTGNLIFPPESYNPASEKDKFKTVSGYIENTVSLDGKSKIIEQILQHLVEKSDANVLYSNYKKVEKQHFPGKLDMAVRTPKGNASLIMENSSINTNPIDAFPYEVPSKYEKAN
jgi:hypothetical protein